MMWMVLRRLQLMLAISMAFAAQAESTKSLLFSPSESAALAKATADFDRLSTTGRSTVEEEAPPATPNIYVSAVADFGSGRWTVWANGVRISPNRQSPWFTVLAVQDDFAVIKVSDEKQEKILLRPQQTWLARSRKIVEGIVP